VRLEGLGKLKKITSSGTRTGDLPACSIVPQPTTLPHAPSELQCFMKSKWVANVLHALRTRHLVTEEEVMYSECILKEKYFVLVQWISWFRYGNVDESPVNNHCTTSSFFLEKFLLSWPRTFFRLQNPDVHCCVHEISYWIPL
jgi:hypothetical protein